MISFHPIIQSNYMEVHEWLSQRRDLDGYRQNSAWNKVKRQLQDATLESAALQYYVLFPAHTAKVAFALQNIIGVDRITNWLKYNAQITVIDVGCGAGAGSIAFVNCLLNLYESGHIQHPVAIHFLGIDPNEYAIALYAQQIKRLQPKAQEFGIKISYRVIPEGDLRAVNQLREELTRQRSSWDVPFLPHVFLLQANVVSPFSARFQEVELKRKRLADLGVSHEELGDSSEVFGKEEATAYKQILENAFIDNLHIITVGTEGYEQRVSELVQAIDNEFQGNSHLVERMGDGEYSCTYAIPDGCYWKEHKNNTQWTLSFAADVSSISNISLADEDWREIQSTKNLLSAWARARHHLLGQTLVDEVEIRLFESRLDANIARLQQQLIAYAQDVVHADDRLHFKFPKSSGKLRPLGLSRIEEEILSTALIQKLGQRISGIASKSYAYKFSRTYGDQSTEYLYENWFDAYSRFIEDARISALNHKGCVVIQTDIKSFYTRIIRDNLVQLSTEQLSRSARVEWLLRVLFSREIDEHEAGHGIVQGNIASGFFANLYLVDLDARFGSNNEWNAAFFRYVDDMIIVVPNPEHVEELLTALEQSLQDIGLELNTGKTDRFFDASEFMRVTDKDEILDNLQSRFQDWINCLWILDSQHRQLFRKSYGESQDEWWYRIESYRICLKEIGVFIDSTLLSRIIYKYLFNDKLCEKDFNWKWSFEVPTLPNSIEANIASRWKIEFKEKNTSWVTEGVSLSDALRKLLSESQEGIYVAIASQDSRSEKKWTRTFRFCVNKLVQIGLYHNDVAQIIVETLVDSPWLIRNPHKLTENLAMHGYNTHIESLLKHYGDGTDQTKEYMKAIVLRSIRFLTEIPHSLWQEVVTSATSQSEIISLMATETWLKVVEDHPELVEEVHIQQIETALRSEPKPISRLMKNYLLIIGKLDGKIIELNEKYDEDTLLRDVYEIIQAKNIDSLFHYFEPAILTREFYSGLRSDHEGAYNPSAPN